MAEPEVAFTHFIEVQRAKNLDRIQFLGSEVGCSLLIVAVSFDFGVFTGTVSVCRGDGSSQQGDVRTNRRPLARRALSALGARSRQPHGTAGTCH